MLHLQSTTDQVPWRQEGGGSRRTISASTLDTCLGITRKDSGGTYQLMQLGGVLDPVAQGRIST